MKPGTYFYYFLIAVLLFGCEGNLENTENHRVRQENEKPTDKFSFFKKETEFTDSIEIDSFLKSNPEFLPYKKKMHKFYSRRDYALAWSEKEKFLPHAGMFINILRNADREGLDPEKFNAAELEKLLEESNFRLKKEEKKTKRKELDLKLSASYFKYSRQLWKGKIDPEDEDVPWYITRKKIKFGKTLDSILDSEAENPFKHFMPVHQEYHKLLDALEHYRTIQKNGGWSAIPAEADNLAPGDTSRLVLLLKKRLYASGELKNLSKDSVFSPDLEAALRKFQERHGLNPDGIPGKKTIEALNIPVSAKIKQILINLERWRWVPEKIGSDYLIVNIPEFRLRIYEKGNEISDMKVIVGKSMNNTPIFNDRLEYIVINPFWNVPRSIVTDEILPALQKDCTYLTRQNMVLYQENPDQPIDPTTINWKEVNPGDFSFRVRQNPGPGNALGHIKFLFPNSFSVYLHDTPTRHLFAAEERDFSHGCIRVEKPIELASYILRKNNRWNGEKIRKTIGKENQWIKLSENEQLPVYILYFTVWVDKYGQLNFRDDIYGHDEELGKLLFQQ